MLARHTYDAVVVGSGPNGLAAAITLAHAGHSVLVYEARDTIGGGMRTAELTLPGFRHDICSAIHPLGVASPFLRTLPLAEHGVDWITPAAAVCALPNLRCQGFGTTSARLSILWALLPPFCAPSHWPNMVLIGSLQQQRYAHCRTYAARVSARHLLGYPSSGRCFPLFAHPPTGRTWC